MKCRETGPIPGPEGEESNEKANTLTPEGRGWPEVDRRAAADRRSVPTPFWGGVFGPHRRGHGRRTGEDRDIYVDVFRRGDVLLLVGIFALNIFDALFTLLWLGRGGSEGNPVMDWLLQLGEHAFLIQKCFVVGFWLVFLIVHKNFRLARLGLWSLAGVYALLFAYHFALVVSGADPTSGGLPSEQPSSKEAGEQGGDRGLDAQSARAETHWREAAGAEFGKLVVGPAAFGSNREHDGLPKPARAGGISGGMRDERPSPLDESGQLILDERTETRALPDLGKQRVASLLETQEELRD